MAPEPILVRNHLAVGDAVVLTAFVRDLSLAFPGRYKVAVNTPYPDVWRNNPHVHEHVVSTGPPKNRGKVLTLPYGEYIPRTEADFNHFVGAYHKAFKKATGVYVPLTAAKPDIHLGHGDAFRKPAERYWVVVGGSKSDFQVKRWVDAHYQTVVDNLLTLGIPVVQAGRTGGYRNDRHPPLRGAVNLLDKTSVREYIQLIAYADGVICPVTSATHIAAAFDRPAVIVAGGAEEWWWEAYHRDNPSLAEAKTKPAVGHRYLHTIGGLPCCAKKGCWRSKVDGAVEKSMCKRRVDVDGRMTPQCMTLVSPDRVTEAVLAYYLDGTLPEIPSMSLPTADRPIQFTRDGHQYTVRMDAVGVSADAQVGKVTLPQVVDLPPAAIESIARDVIKLTEAAQPAPSPPPAPVARIKGDERLTICSVFYGKAHELHARWLNAVRTSTHTARFDVRVFCNDLCPKSLQLLERAVDEGVVRYVYDAGKANPGKYPAMRTMFHDPLRPVETEWVLWLDDDTFMDVNRGWFVGALDFIRHNPTASAFGAVYGHQPHANGQRWLKAGAWHKGKPLPQGGVKFLSGSCWFVKMDAVRAAGIPDARLKNNGGDVTIGEQLRQNGFVLAGWNADKTAVAWSMTPRRGVSEPGPFSLPC